MTFKGKTRQQVFNEANDKGYYRGFADGYRKKAHEPSQSVAGLIEKAYEDGVQAGWDARKDTEKMNSINNFWDANLSLMRHWFFEWWEPVRSAPYTTPIHHEREETSEDAAAWRAFEAGWMALARELNWKLEQDRETE